jgi:anti-sigma factor RsiW
MSCHEFEGLIALHVEGDLDETERQRVEAHLRACSECQSLAKELGESQAAFKSMRQEVADQSALSSVRARVLADVAAMEGGSLFDRLFWGGFRQRATLAGIAVLVLGGAGLWFISGWHIPRDLAEPPVVEVRAPVPGPESVVEVASPSPQKPAARPQRRQRPRPAAVREEYQPQVTIKLLTDDPNVIIYWLGDEKGD